MARDKKNVHRVEMTEGKRNIIRQLLEEYTSRVPETSRKRSKIFWAGRSKK